MIIDEFGWGIFIVEGLGFVVVMVEEFVKKKFCVFFVIYFFDLGKLGFLFW